MPITEAGNPTLGREASQPTAPSTPGILYGRSSIVSTLAATPHPFPSYKGTVLVGAEQDGPLEKGIRSFGNLDTVPVWVSPFSGPRKSILWQPHELHRQAVGRPVPTTHCFGLMKKYLIGTRSS